MPEHTDLPDHGTDRADQDTTLGGYFSVHNRPPAFEGTDGQPYTVSIETEQVSDLINPFVGFLVFPRWAETGLGIVGHVETPILFMGRSSQDVREEAEALTLLEVKRLLDEAIRNRTEKEDEKEE